MRCLARKVLAAWVAETAEGLDLKFAGTVEMLGPVAPIAGEPAGAG